MKHFPQPSKVRNEYQQRFDRHLDYLFQQSKESTDSFERKKWRSISKEEYAQIIDAHARIFLRGAQFCICVEPHILPQILQDRRLKTQFETRTARNYLPRDRAGVEYRLWDIPSRQIR